MCSGLVPGSCGVDYGGYGPDYGAVWNLDSMGCGDQVLDQLKRKILSKNENIPPYAQKMARKLTLSKKSVNFSQKVPTDR